MVVLGTGQYQLRMAISSNEEEVKYVWMVHVSRSVLHTYLRLGLLHHLIIRINQQLLPAFELCVGVLRLPETFI